MTAKQIETLKRMAANGGKAGTESFDLRVIRSLQKRGAVEFRWPTEPSDGFYYLTEEGRAALLAA
jgi:hypothetical protein